MSNLLSQASLVMIPSGYKEDVVYSQIPTSGAGDLTFTRASNGTRIDSNGNVEVVPWNYFENSNLFTSWVKSGSSVTLTSGQTDPIGGTNAWLYARTLAYDYLLSYVSVDKYTVYCTVKKATSNFFRIAGTGGGDAVFNVNTGVVVETNGSVTATIESLGNGWYKCVAYFDQNNGGFYLQNFPVANASDGSGSVYIYQAQCNIGSTAKPYFPTTDRLNVPRLTYQNGGGGCPSLLLEKQSTNLFTYSEQFDNAGWSKEDLTVSANATTSPDGTQNADKIIANTSNTDHSIYQGIVSTGSAQTFSVYAKAGEYNYIFLGSNNNFATDGVFFNLSNGTISQNTSGLTASIESVGNGWYRCIVNSSSWPTIYALISLSTNGTSFNFAGNNTSGIYVWGAQLEASSYPTSYIPTTSSSATRVADACYKTGISSLIGQTEGTLFADVNWNVKAESGSPVIGILTLNNNVANLDNCIVLGIERQTGGGNRVYCFIINSGTGQADLFGSLISSGRYKIALGYKANDFVLYVNGVQIATDTSGTVPTTSEVLLGQRFQGDSANLNDTINETILFPTRLTNAELASLTTI